MAEQRPAFRFRLPWLIQSEQAAPPPRPPPFPIPQNVTPPTTTQNPIPSTSTQRPPTTAATTTQNPIPPTSAQRPPTTTPIAPSPAATPPTTTTTQSSIPPTPTQRPPSTTTTQTPIAPSPALRPPTITTTQSLIPPTPATQRPPTTTPIAPTPAATPPTITSQNSIPPTPTQRPPSTTTTQTPIVPSPTLRPPTTTQSLIPPTPATQRPPTTTQTPIAPTPDLRPPTTAQTPIPATTTTQSQPTTTTTTQTQLAPTPSPTTAQTPIPPSPTTTQTSTQRPSTTIQTLVPQTPAPRPPITTQVPNSPSPTQRPLSRPFGLDPLSISPPPLPTSQSPTSKGAQPALVKIPQTPSDPPSPATPPQRPPFRPAGTAQSQTSSPNPPRNEPQTSSPIRKVGANSQPTSPSRTATQSRVSSQPASPSRVGTQSKVPSRSSSPSRGTIQSRTSSQPSSPSRKQPSSQTGSLSRSPSRLASQATGITSSLPPSPANISTMIEPKVDPVDQTPSSSSVQHIAQETLPPIFSDPKPLVSEKEEPKNIPPPLESHPKTENSNSIPSNSDHAVLHDKPNATNEPQEKTTDSVVEHREIKEKTVDELIAEYSQSKSKAETEKNPSLTVQKDQKQPEKQLHTSEKYTTSISNGKQTKTSTSHPVDKSPVSESRQRPNTSNGAQIPQHKEIKDDISSFTQKIQKMATTQSKKPMGENPMSVITVAGENRGAFMHIGSETDKREGAIHISRGYKHNPDESRDAIDGEGSSRGRKLKETNNGEDNASKAYVNNNTQGVNNSIVFNASITQGNPGVHLRIIRYLPEPNKSEKNTESLLARKAEYNVTPAEKLTYQPTVRRRCLRGLLLESSDSDDDNPEKPRRHGCRNGCRKKSKDGEIDVV